MGDFTGFTINGVHSSDLGITRISDGDRYDETLLPDIEDKTIDIPGNDGSYYYGSFYKPREFKINVAFDHLTEEQLRRLRQLTSNRKLFPLVFDEAPYKQYTVKASAPPEFHCICFDEEIRETEGKNLGVAKLLDDYSGTGKHDPYISSQSQSQSSSTPTYRRIYKGEGDLTFIAYNPYARAPYKSYTEYESAYSNVNEWKDAARLKSSTELQDYSTFTNGKIRVYNPGDIATPFKLYIPFNNGTIPALTIQLQKRTGSGTTDNDYTNIIDKVINLSEVTQITDGSEVGHTGILINTKNSLVEGAYQTINSTIVSKAGFLYNQYVLTGNFFKIPSSDNSIDPFDGRIVVSVARSGMKIDYDYLYF